jgi:hypothetical protein
MKCKNNKRQPNGGHTYISLDKHGLNKMSRRLAANAYKKLAANFKIQT